MKLVLIEWFDSHGPLDGWQILEDMECTHEPLKCRSVGWLLHDGEACKVIMPHIAGDKNMHLPSQGRGILTIPTKSIVRLTELMCSKD